MRGIKLRLAYLFIVLITTSCAAQVERPSTTSSNENAIIGGVETVSGAYPWMVAIAKTSGAGPIVLYDSFWCGGTLVDIDGDQTVDPDWVLSAAHCFAGEPFKPNTTDLSDSAQLKYRTFVGVHDLKSASAGSLKTIKSITVHPNYNQTTSENDVALIHLAASVTGISTPPALLLIEEEPSYAANGDSATILGWGTTSTVIVKAAAKLRQGTINIFAGSSCESAYDGTGEQNKPFSFDAAKMICAGTTDGSVDACKGDSGGPLLVLDSQGKWKLAGIVSYGWGCADPEYPGVYTKASRFKTWMDSKR